MNAHFAVALMLTATVLAACGPSSEEVEQDKASLDSSELVVDVAGDAPVIRRADCGPLEIAMLIVDVAGVPHWEVTGPAATRKAVPSITLGVTPDGYEETQPYSRLSPGQTVTVAVFDSANTVGDVEFVFGDELAAGEVWHDQGASAVADTCPGS